LPGKGLEKQAKEYAQGITSGEWAIFDVISCGSSIAFAIDCLEGVDSNCPLDHCRLLNMAPNGTMTVVDHVPYQFFENRPTPELANHRTPIKNLYATGCAWHMGANSGSSEAYNCYKIIAKDMGLPKLWEEPGMEEPDSLVEQQKIIMKKLEESGKVVPK